MFSDAAASGSPEGYFGLAEMTVSGLGTGADIAKAVSLYEEASRRGSIPADFRLGLIFENAEGFIDPQRAFACYRKCADAGF